MSEDKEELKTAWEEWNKNHDEQSRKKLFDKAEPIISQAVNTFAGGKDDPVVDLKSRELAQKAFETYDPTKAKLKTHLFRQMQPLTRTVHNRANQLQIPQQAWWDLKNMEEAQKELKYDLGHDPTAQQLADSTGLSERRVGMLRELSGEGVPESVLREKDPEAILGLEKRDETKDDQWTTKAVYHSLSPTDQKIMEYRTGLFGSEQIPNKEIAQRLGISSSAVSQRASKIASMVEEVMGSK